MAGYFTERSMIWRVRRERIVAFAGSRALLMQAAHPVAFAGFFASTAALNDPYARLRRTAAVLDTVTFGTRAEADRAAARVRAVHRRMRGELTEPVGVFSVGTKWGADDPDLLLWIIATLADSERLVYQRYVARLSRADRQALWDDYRIVGGLFGLAASDMPASVEDVDAYMHDMVCGGLLCVTPQARRLAIDIVLHPPAPAAARPVVDLVNAITIGLLPDGIRRQYGLQWGALRGLALHGGAEYTRRLVMPFVPGRLRHVAHRRRDARTPGLSYR